MNVINLQALNYPAPESASVRCLKSVAYYAFWAAVTVITFCELFMILEKAA